MRKINAVYLVAFTVLGGSFYVAFNGGLPKVEIAEAKTVPIQKIAPAEVSVLSPLPTVAPQPLRPLPAEIKSQEQKPVPKRPEIYTTADGLLQYRASGPLESPVDRIAQKCLTIGIESEAENQPLEGKTAVGFAITNRADSSQEGAYRSRGTKICREVYRRKLLAKGRWHYEFDGMRHPRMRITETSLVSAEIAGNILRGKVVAQGPMREVFYFHNPKHSSRGGKGWQERNTKFLFAIQDHTFGGKKVPDKKVAQSK